MGDKSTIEWTEATWNPVTGCDQVSPGCANCYALRFAERFRGVAGHPYEVGFDLTLRPERLEQPLGWRRPRRIFVNSMGDLFHEEVPLSFIERVFSVMAQAHWHVFQVLTKRADRLAELASTLRWAPNVWVGVSVENRRWSTRIDRLREVPAATRFLSCEPLLGDLGKLDLGGIDWVIAGGESGPGARPMNPEWARSIRDQCLVSATPFFFKQWGRFDATGRPKGKKAAGRLLDGRTWDEYPHEAEFPSGGGQRKLTKVPAG